MYYLNISHTLITFFCDGKFIPAMSRKQSYTIYSHIIQPADRMLTLAPRYKRVWIVTNYIPTLVCWQKNTYDRDLNSKEIIAFLVDGAQYHKEIILCGLHLWAALYCH